VGAKPCPCVRSPFRRHYAKLIKTKRVAAALLKVFECFLFSCYSQLNQRSGVAQQSSPLSSLDSPCWLGIIRCRLHEIINWQQHRIIITPCGMIAQYTFLAGRRLDPVVSAMLHLHLRPLHAGFSRCMGSGLSTETWVSESKGVVA